MIYTPGLNYLPLVSSDLRPCFSSSSLLVQLHVVLQGDGLCVLPCFLAGTEPRLKRVLREQVTLTRSFYMITHSEIRNLARIQIARDFIAKEIAAAGSLFIS